MDSQWSDPGLLEACRTGSSEAWREVYRRASVCVGRVASAWGIPSVEAEDIVQQVTIALAQQIDGVKCPSAFIARVAHNQCVDWLRRKRPAFLNDDPGGGDDEDRGDPIDDLPDPRPIRSELERNEGFAVLWEAMRQADQKCWRLFILRCGRSCSYVDIANQERIPEAQVGMKLSRCFDKLREHMRRQPGAMDALEALWPA